MGKEPQPVEPQPAPPLEIGIGSTGAILEHTCFNLNLKKLGFYGVVTEMVGNTPVGASCLACKKTVAPDIRLLQEVGNK
jgi:hypothetical protein